jgi:hypothetical protein
MKKLPALLLCLFLGACAQTATQKPAPEPPPRPAPARPPEANLSRATRNNCYSLLHQLLEDQKKVGLLRFIKKEEEAVQNLVKRIASASATGSELLETFAKQDPALRLDDVRLPTGEVATREAIAATKEDALLARSGEDFALALLLTQTEALSYAWHLAKVAGENEPDRQRARALASLGKDMESLYNETVALVGAKRRQSAGLIPPEVTSK